MLKDGEPSKQSIQVTIRVRPPSQKELNDDPRICVRVEKEAHSLVLSAIGADPKAFTFDSICDGENTQQDIFVKVGINSTERCLEGYNCCIFAYGQTGAGKTFTMMGVNYQDSSYFEKRGLIPRTLEYLFDCIDKEVVELRSEYLVKCTFLEIYNEQIIDLLNKSNSNLQLREDLKKGVYVEGLSEETVSRSEEAMEILRRGSKGRHVGSTCYNETSSRSHSVLSMLIESKAVKNGIVNVKTRRFHFIDLAGSERTKQSNGERLKEGCSINKSLHVLGMVINSLVESTEGKTRHVNYRDSKLTFLLKDALGGNSKTHLIANISPNLISCQETLSTLTFARRVKLIKLNKVSINEDASGNLDSLKSEIRRLKHEIMQLRSGPTREMSLQTSHQQSSEPESREISHILMKNQNKLGLQKILQDYIEESIEKDTKFQLQLARRDQKMTWFRDALQQYSKNEIHLRMIISLYEEKFKRLKFLEGKLNKKMDELSAAEREQIVGHLSVEKELLSRQLQTYKQLLNETPFIKSLMKSNGTAPEDSKTDDSVGAQLAGNLNFLKELKGQLEQTIKQRLELNSLIENYSMNKEQEMSPRKRKAIEREYDIKEQEYKDKLERLELEADILKGAIEETELLLNESVNKEIALQEQLKEQASKLAGLEKQLTSLEERQQQKYASLAKEKEDCQRDYEQRMTNVSLQQLELRKTVEKHLDSLAESEKKNKRQDEALQQLIRDLAEMQLRNDYMQKTVRDVEDKGRLDREAVVMREETIMRLSGMLEEVKAQRDVAILQMEGEKQAKRTLKDDLQNEREQLTNRYNQRIQSLNGEVDKLRSRETELLKQLGELRTESESRSQRVQSWQQKHHALQTQLETERNQLRKREDEIKELLHKKANTDSELQTQVNTLSLQSMSLSQQLKETEQRMEELRENLYVAQEKLFEAERELEIKGADIQRLNEQFDMLKQKERVTQKAREELDNSMETLKHNLKEQQDKFRRAQLEVDRLKQREKELQQNNEILKGETEASEHRLRESVMAGTRISEQLKELTEQFQRKEKTLEKVKDSHEREVVELKQQLETQKQKNMSHEAYTKKVFEECMANKDKIVADLKSHNGMLNGQLVDQGRKCEQYRIRLRDADARLKDLSEMVAEKDSSILEVNEQILLLKDEIEHMKNIFEQKMEERENSYNEFIDKKNECIDRYEVESKKLVGQMEELRVALDAEVVFGQQKSQSIVELTETVNRLEGAMQQICSNFNVDTGSVDEFVERVSTKQQKLEEKEEYHAAAMSNLNDTLASVQQELATANGELKKSKDRIRQLQSDASNVVKQSQLTMAGFHEEIEKEKHSKAQLSHELSHTIGVLNAELENHKCRSQAVEQRLNKRIGELEKQLAAVEQQARSDKDRLSDSTSRIGELDERLQNISMELETIQSQFNESEVKVRQLTDGLEQKQLLLTKTRNSLGHRVRELEYELQNTQRALEDEMKLKEASRGSDDEKERVFNLRIEKLKSDNEQLRGQITSLYGQVSDQQAKLNKLEVKDINLTKLTSELESEKRQLTSRLALLTEESKDKQAVLNTLQKEKERADKMTEAVQEYKDKLQKQLQQSEQMELRLHNERFQEMKRLKEEFLNEIHKSNGIHEQLERENAKLRDQAQRSYQSVESIQQSSSQEKQDLKQHVAVLEQECDGLREQLSGLSEKYDQVEHQASLAGELERELRQERSSTTNLKKLIDNIERQKMQLQAELEDKDESQKRLLAKMTRVEQTQPKLLEDRKSIMKTNDLLERSRMELLEYKKTVEENNRVFKKLKAEMQAKEQNFVQMHEKAEEFCRNQELKVASIRADYEKLENQHQLLIREKERLETLREENENLHEQLGSYKAYQSKADRRMEQLQQTVQNLSSEAAELREELESYRRQPTRVGTYSYWQPSETSSSDVKMQQYVNKLKEQNCLLKRQKQILSDRLNQQCEQKLRLKSQLGHHQKKLSKDMQNRTSLNILESMSNNVEVALKIQLEKKLAEIKYLQEGYGELCALLNIKRLPENKMKGSESTVGLILSQVQTLVQELSEMKGRLRDKQKQLDSKNVHYEVINKQYNHLKLKILEAKGVKQQSYQKKPSTAKLQGTTFTSYRPSFNDAYGPTTDMSSFQQLKQQQQLRNRQLSRTRKPY